MILTIMVLWSCIGYLILYIGYKLEKDEFMEVIRELASVIEVYGKELGGLIVTLLLIAASFMIPIILLYYWTKDFYDFLFRRKE